MTCELRLPSYVARRGGEIRWEGPAPAETAHGLSATLSLTERRRAVVTVLVGLHFDDGSRVFKVVDVVLTPSGLPKALPVRPVVTRAGARVIEHGGIER